MDHCRYIDHLVAVGAHYLIYTRWVHSHPVSHRDYRDPGKINPWRKNLVANQEIRMITSVFPSYLTTKKSMKVGFLGLQRGTVKLVPYNVEWAVLFQDEKEVILSLLGDEILGIEHVGSTSISGMIAKPILGLMVAVESIDDYESLTLELEKIGYQFMRDNRED